MLEPDPSWTQMDSALVAFADIDRGRQDEFNRTGTGTAVVGFHDQEGLLDPTNVGSPYFGELDGIQARLDLYDPVAAGWETIFRGFLDDRPADVHPSGVLIDYAIQLVDGFDYLARAEAAPGVAGNTVPAGSEGNVFYEDTDVQTRIAQVLADAQWPAALSVIFTGNVDVQETVYDPQASFLSILADAADAEFPDVANQYIDRIGRFVFHGRFSRFDPDGTAAGATPGAWDFNRWLAGDGAAIIADPTTVQIRGLSYGRPMGFVYNSALCTPKGIAQVDVAGQVVTDLTSIAAYGVRPWSATDLIVALGTTSGNTANQECLSFAQYIVDNYAATRTRVESLVFRSIGSADARAAEVWALLTKIDISDVIELTTTHPGGGGFAGDGFFVEGVSYHIEPLNGEYANVTCEANVSPVGYYNTPF